MTVELTRTNVIASTNGAKRLLCFVIIPQMRLVQVKETGLTTDLFILATISNVYVAPVMMSEEVLLSH